MKKYFIAGDKLFAFNAKCCTSSMCRAIVKTHHPKIEDYLRSKVKFPNGRNLENQQLHQFVPMRVNPDRPVAVLLREPVSRFRSALGYMNLGHAVDEVLRIMVEETGEGVANGNGVLIGRRQPLAANVHLAPQTRFEADEADITYFTMPNQVDECAEWLGLETPLPRINETKYTKPDLTQEQLAKVQAYYRKDIDLWESLNG